RDAHGAIAVRGEELGAGRGPGVEATVLDIRAKQLERPVTAENRRACRRRASVIEENRLDMTGTGVHVWKRVSDRNAPQEVAAPHLAACARRELVRSHRYASALRIEEAEPK